GSRPVLAREPPAKPPRSQRLPLKPDRAAVFVLASARLRGFLPGRAGNREMSMVSLEQVRDALKSCLGESSGFVELRFHAKSSRSLTVEKGRLENFSNRSRQGTGVRVLEDGSFGFAACGSAEPAELKVAIQQAR